MFVHVRALGRKGNISIQSVDLMVEAKAYISRRVAANLTDQGFFPCMVTLMDYCKKVRLGFQAQFPSDSIMMPHKKGYCWAMRIILPKPASVAKD